MSGRPPRAAQTPTPSGSGGSRAGRSPSPGPSPTCLSPSSPAPKGPGSGLCSEWAAWRRARWRVLALTGVAGIGRTTLLAALAHDGSLRRHFRDGILWLEGAGEDRLEKAACRVGLKGSPGGRQEEWARWAGDPSRRLLVVIDDVPPR